MNSYRQILCVVYLLLAVLGAVLPTLANIEFIRQYGPAFDVKLFISLANSNPAAQSLSRDLFIAASTITICFFVESRTH